MALVKLQPDSPAVDNSKTLPEVLKEENKSVFTTLFPEAKADTLLKFVEGYPWTVNFYGQMVNDANTLEHLDPGIPGLLQPVYHVVEMILQVSTPLTSNYDETNGITTVTGTALFPYGIKPNQGDSFIASVDSGEDAIFVINNVFRKTHRKNALYEVTYSLYKYTSQDPGTVATLNTKIQERYFFNKDTNYFNRDLLITAEVKEARERLIRYLRESEDYYFGAFAQKDAGSIFIPGTEDAYYDPHLMNFLTKTVPYSRLIQYPFFKYTFRDKYASQQTFFDMLLGRNLSFYRTINQQQGFVNTAAMYTSSRFGTAFHAGVDYMLYPKSPNVKKDIDKFAIQSPIDVFKTGYVTGKNYELLNLTIKTKNNDTEYVKPVLHAMFENDYYVVSENFYNYIQDNSTYADTSFVELIIYKFLRSEAIAKEDLVVLMESYQQWSLLHQFYILPVMWLIIRNTL